VQNLIALAAVFHELTSSDVVAYFLFRNFVLYQRKFSINIKSLREQLEAVLRKEDSALYEHLRLIKAFEIIPVDLWFGRYFAQVLHKSSLARICDKVIGGSCKILSYVGAAILIVRRHPLLAQTGPEAAIELLKKIPEDTSDVVVNKALDLYYS
ncbi:TBC1 domain family member 7, partial [Stegodyphus mimosarum]